MTLERYRQYADTTVLRRVLAVFSSDDFSVEDTQLFNPAVNGIPLCNNNEPLYHEGVKYYPSAFSYSPPTIEQNELHEAQLSIASSVAIIFRTIKDVNSEIEVKLTNCEVHELELPIETEVYDDGDMITVVQRHEIEELDSAEFVTDAFTRNHQAISSSLKNWFIDQIGIGTKSVTVDLFPAVFEKVF